MKTFTGLDLSGQKFGRLTVVQLAGFTSFPCEPDHLKPVWVCQCDCGAIKRVLGASLRNGKTLSCGCLNLELTSSRSLTHGWSGWSRPEHRLYGMWKSMKSRCRNPRHKNWARYGGRGIKVCTRWLDFQKFLDDMEDSWREGLTLERIDNDKGYFKTNCRWATRREQSNNGHHNRQLTVDGITLTLAQWERQRGFRRGVISQRLNTMGWTPEAAVKTPLCH